MAPIPDRILLHTTDDRRIPVDSHDILLRLDPRGLACVPAVPKKKRAGFPARKSVVCGANGRI